MTHGLWIAVNLPVVRGYFTAALEVEIDEVAESVMMMFI
jgi:hypothetical protein